MTERCVEQGCAYPDKDSPFGDARRAAARGLPPSVCIYCAEVNYKLRAWLAKKTKARKAKRKVR
jgi:hypothetical protein